MTTPLTTFEQAVKLKEVGFDWEVINFFTKYKDEPEHPHVLMVPGNRNYNCFSISDRQCISCPTVDEAVRWLRDVKGLHISTRQIRIQYWRYEIQFLKEGGSVIEEIEYLKTYDQALSAGITEAFKHVKP